MKTKATSNTLEEGHPKSKSSIWAKREASGPQGQTVLVTVLFLVWEVSGYLMSDQIPEFSGMQGKFHHVHLPGPETQPIKQPHRFWVQLESAQGATQGGSIPACTGPGPEEPKEGPLPVSVHLRKMQPHFSSSEIRAEEEKDDSLL